MSKRKFGLKLVGLLFLLLSVKPMMGQNSLTLQECYTLASENFPLIKQKGLIAKTAEYSVSSLAKGVWPQVVLNGQATYQSEVTSIKINIPGMKFDAPSKDQYKVYADVSQPITDIFTVKDQKQLVETNAEIQQQNVEVEIYKLRDRINQLYFGILMVDEQLKLNHLVDNDLATGRKKVEAAIKNGVDYKSSLDKIKAEEIKNQQRAIELRAMRNAYTEMLSYFINKPIDGNMVFTTPAKNEQNLTINRPELKVFEHKKITYSLQDKISRNKNIPKLSLFLQAGAGKPSPLNMISNSFSPFAIGGIKASWSIMNLYTRQNEKWSIRLDEQMNEVQKELFVFNTQLIAKQQQSELSKLGELIDTDDELVALRSSVKNTANIQLANGVITTNDFIKEVNAEDQARQSKLLHEIQLLVAQYNLQNTLGN